ncbi:hypothetical protein A2380_02730 [candidate division WWE3 bacterium RIFOXYB1_FULL_43_24]|uniref:Uncharacterized protein n=1 Tax=candidate division WWE3 bacterium GW2011_GWF1_42_14 TaxID=1619138 RepID=A0A0G1AWE3_UNCKA|nr:MAG: hypothetical protein UU92_C0007G0069 [candidate division WWE3 bacterium GW2011_GWA1_42_12]KKS38421.1 MAG: hypothetical protein UV00_C0007G0002 [candidate division WWE3 bacterium GW2011_GWF1_42_14]KKS39647.1 MAG: hypothetical protein UV03_C0025G0002 [candidate division WWE3 bacterium GW2011_GWE1_42_16]OGC58632.1 MAG: hypothetical protein A2212_01995 [candidate division WWE3 bacterium RIFOXYA1_FULL_42_9]OGC69020.1 MAG: hypothetical protein A2380_02730 [candidate division WWE3 bacterium RI
MKRFSVVIVLVMVFAVLGTAASSAQAQVGEMLVSVNDGSLENHGCDSTESEWHFIINQLSSPSLAPASIHVVWANGSQEDVPLQKVTSGGMAHYATSSNLGSRVESATTYIYEGWMGNFNLSHGPCGSTDTPTPTITVTETVTETVTQTPTETVTVTNTPTETETQTVTTTETVTQTPTETITQTPTETVTGTPTITDAPTTTVTVTNTPPADPTPTEPSLGGGAPTKERPTLWLFALVLMSGVAVVVFKKH